MPVFGRSFPVPSSLFPALPFANVTVTPQTATAIGRVPGNGQNFTGLLALRSAGAGGAATVTATPTAAAATGAAGQPVSGLTVFPSAATGAGAASKPGVSFTPAAALGTGAAYLPGGGYGAGLASGTGSALSPPVTVTAFPGAAVATGANTWGAGSYGGITVFPSAALGTGAVPPTAGGDPPFSAVGTLGHATANGFTLTPSAVGDFILLWVTSETLADFATALSSSNVTWTVLVAHTAFTSVVQTVFIGQVTSASGAAVTITFSAGSPTLRIAWQEFSCTAGYAAVALDASGTVNAASNGTMPVVTPSRAGDLYAGYVFDTGSGVAGTTSGYVYQLDANSNQYAYNLNCANATQTPNIGDTGGTMGIGVMLYVLGAPAGAASGTGAALQPSATVTANPSAALGTGAAFTRNAPPGLAAGTGAAFTPQVSAGGGNPTAALGTGAALAPASQVSARPAAAAGSGAAFPPGMSFTPGTASGAGAALPPASQVHAPAGVAAGTGAAYPGHVAIIRFPENLGAVITLPGPAAVVTEPGLGCTITLADLGGILTLPSFGAMLTGWTMQTAGLNLLEFNDVTMDLAITNNGSPYNLSGATLNMLFKTAAGTPDANALIFSTAGGSPAITITNASAGLAVAQIPNADLQSETYGFYRIDVVVGGFQNTAVSGPITWTSL
jgi:hypothetical protein